MSNSIGDLKNSGLQGNNWPWQYKVLLGLDKIVSAIGGTEYEAQIIKATCPLPGPPTSGYYLEVRIYNTTTGSFGAPIYYLPGSTTPVNLSTCTKEYANDSLVLTQILTELIDQGVTLDAIETAVEGTLDVNILSSVELEIKNDVGNPIPVILPTGTVTASLERITTGSGTVATGAYSVAFFNAGDQPALVALQALNPGERVTFEAPEGKTLGPIFYNVGLAILGQIRDLVISKVI